MIIFIFTGQVSCTCETALFQFLNLFEPLSMKRVSTPMNSSRPYVD